MNSCFMGQVGLQAMLIGLYNKTICVLGYSALLGLAARVSE